MNAYPIRGIMCWDRTVFADNDEKLTDLHLSLLDSQRLTICDVCYFDCMFFEIKGESIRYYKVGGFEIRFIESYKEVLVPNYVNGDTFDKAVNHCKTKKRSYWREI